MCMSPKLEPLTLVLNTGAIGSPVGSARRRQQSLPAESALEKTSIEEQGGGAAFAQNASCGLDGGVDKNELLSRLKEMALHPHLDVAATVPTEDSGASPDGPLLRDGDQEGKASAAYEEPGQLSDSQLPSEEAEAFDGGDKKEDRCAVLTYLSRCGVRVYLCGCGVQISADSLFQ